MKVDPACAHAGYCCEVATGSARRPCRDSRPCSRPTIATGEISAAWVCRELLRQLLAAHGPTRYSRHETAHRRTRFLTACATGGHA